MATSLSSTAPFSSLSISGQEEFLKKVPLPAKTKTYIPVTHEEVIEKTSEVINTAGRVIASKHYSIASEGDIMSGIYTLAPEKSGDPYDDVIAVQNSYNKRVTLKYAYGLYERSTGSRFITGEIAFKRKHTGSVISEFNDVLNKSIGYLADHRSDILNAIEMMKFTLISKDKAAELAGRLFFNEQVIYNSHLSDMRVKFNGKTTNPFDGDNHTNLWTFYTFLSNAIKDLHASQQIDSYITAYNFFKINFGLI